MIPYSDLKTPLATLFGAAFLVTGMAASAMAQQKPAAKPQQAAATAAKPGQTQALLLETSGRWQAFSSQPGRAKMCYALSKPASRSPANLKDVEGFLFISSRPGEGVRNEISVVMKFDLKENVEHQAIIGDQRFALAAKGQNLWLKNPAEESRMLDSMRRGGDLEIRATSKKGNATSDKYSLSGIAQTVKRAEEACK
jgi:invasion protein IalB